MDLKSVLKRYDTKSKNTSDLTPHYVSREANKKLIERGTKIIMNSLKIDQKNAKELLLKYGSVRKVLNLKI